MIPLRRTSRIPRTPDPAPPPMPLPASLPGVIREAVGHARNHDDAVGVATERVLAHFHRPPTATEAEALVRALVADQL